MVESQPSKLLVAGSIPVSRSISQHHIPLTGWSATFLLKVSSGPKLPTSFSIEENDPYNVLCRTTVSGEMFQMYQQATIPVSDPVTFGAVQGAIDRSFSPAGVKDFLKSLDKGNLRIREFEEVLRAGKLGPEAPASYGKLNDCDQGQIRELYLASLEKVPGDLRDKYFRLYAYY